MNQVIFFVMLLIVIIITVLSTLLLCSKLLIKKRKEEALIKIHVRIKRNVIVLCSLMVILSVFSLFSQLFAKTPPILDANGNVLENSIAELTKIELNNRKEWISIRGENKDNPVLLFLAGGPGGTQMAAVRHDLAELEKQDRKSVV